MNRKRKLELYIHIPFCVRKCAYCDFLSGPADLTLQKTYVQTLLQEIRQFPEEEQYYVSSIFFGGGTPSILPSDWIAEIMELIYEKFCVDPEAEITIECNPGTADFEKLKTYRASGINRISFGLQSADNEELKLLGRIHTWEDFQKTYSEACEAGFSNINVDLMSALPGQTIESWKETLKKVLTLKPQHISAYSLIIEEGTPFYERYAEDARRREEGEPTEILPSEEDEREMYRLTEEFLKEAAFHRYEISNYALSGCECSHNIGYWDGTEYVGFGLGASSLLVGRSTEAIGKLQVMNFDEAAHPIDAEANEIQDSGCIKMYRIKNTENMERYLKDFSSDKDIDELTLQERMEEFMFLGLRMMHGISEQEFLERFGRKIDEIYGKVIRYYQNAGLLTRKDGRIALSTAGIDVSNAVMAEFLLS